MLDSKKPNPYDRTKAAINNRIEVTDKQRISRLFVETKLRQQTVEAVSTYKKIWQAIQRLTKPS